jgi:DNA-binding Xre family transcriptional regulator
MELRILLGKLSTLEKKCSKLRKEVSDILHYVMKLYEEAK